MLEWTMDWHLPPGAESAVGASPRSRKSTLNPIFSKMKNATSSIILATGLGIAACHGATTILIDYDDGIAGNGMHDASIRNGGFEDSNVADGTAIPDIPVWNSYFAEGDTGAILSTTNPATGVNRGTISGFSSTGTRYHLTQTIPSAVWTIQQGDVFKFSAKVRAGLAFDVGTDFVQFVLHVVDSGGVPVPTTVGNADRLLQASVPAASITSAGYFEFSVTSTAVPAGSPWIGNRIQPRFLVVGDRSEFALLDDVFLSATAVPEPRAFALLAFAAVGLLRRGR